MKGYIILQVMMLLCGHPFKCEDISINVTEGLWYGNNFKCDTTVTLRCHVMPSSFLVQWFVGNPIGQRSDTDCFASGCGPSKAFSGRYAYTYNESAGISDLKIQNVNISDNKLVYKCSNVSSHVEFTANVKVPPSSRSTVNETNHFLNETEFKVTTSCIYPASLAKFLWHSSKIDGTRPKTYPFNKERLTQCTSSIDSCVNANASEYVSSTIKLPNLPSSQPGSQRVINVEIIFDNIPLFNSTVGTYMDAAAISEISCTIGDNCTATNSKCDVAAKKCSCLSGYREDDTDGASCITVLGSNCTTNNGMAVCTVNNSICGTDSKCECKSGYVNAGVHCLKDTTTISTTTSAPSLPSSYPETITTSISTVPTITGKMQKRKADNTTTILIAAFSSIAGIILLLTVVFVVIKIRKRHIKRSDATRMQTINNDLNKQK